MTNIVETFRNALKIPELRSKLIYTMIILLLYRLGTAVPVPFVNPAELQAWFEAMGDTVFGMANILSGQAFSSATLFALGIAPYITASIVMQLLSIAVPAIEKLQKSGEEGRKKISQITRYLTVALGLITGFGYYMTLRAGFGMGVTMLTNDSFFIGVVIVMCYTAGSSLIMWLGERINENGIGNGISMILFANIISTLPSWILGMVGGVWETVTGTGTAADVIMQIVRALVFIAAGIFTLGFVVFFSNAERRIPVQYSKRMVGRKMMGGQNTYLPMKVNMSGVMPIIFASSMVSIPAMVLGFINANPEHGTIAWHITRLFGTTSPLYMALQFALIIAFSYFYISISFNPIEVSNNLKKNGGFIPGIRPGKPTTDYITKILHKIVLIGGLFLGIVAVFPLVANSVISLINPAWMLGAIAFAGSSLLIVVGVALETTREIEAQMTMRHYKGFLE